MKTVVYSNYYEPLVRRPLVRRLLGLPGHEVIDFDNGVLRCPRCDKKGRNIPHGKNRVCKKCNLYMERWGNILEIRQAPVGA